MKLSINILTKQKLSARALIFAQVKAARKHIDEINPYWINSLQSKNWKTDIFTVTLIWKTI